MPKGIIVPLEGVVNGPRIPVPFLGDVSTVAEMVRSVITQRDRECVRRVLGRRCLVCGEHCPHGTAGHHVKRAVLCRPCRLAGWLLRPHPVYLAFVEVVCPQCNARLFPHIGICPKCLFPEVTNGERN